MVIVPALFPSTGAVEQASRPHRGAGPREHGSDDPFRARLRLHGRAAGGDAGGRRDPRSGRRGHRRAQRAVRRSGRRFFLFHRSRLWNESQGCWMGWERKRGKIEELNRLLRGATDTSFTAIRGDVSVLSKVRFCITLDSDTRLPRDTAKELIGDRGCTRSTARATTSRGRRVVDGYGILQPRVSVTMSSAAGSIFSKMYAGHTGVDPYTTAVSDTYQDLFAEGVYTGKGLYDVDAFSTALAGRVPGERRALARPLRGPLRPLRARLRPRGGRRLPVDGARPHAAPAPLGAGRLADRGLALPEGADGRTAGEEPAAVRSARWKIFDNLRRSLVPPRSWCCSWSPAGRSCPASRSHWTLAAVGVLALPVFWVARRVSSVGPPLREPMRVFTRSRLHDVWTALAQTGIGIILLLHHARRMLGAIGVTLWRVLVTRRRLLVWESAALHVAPRPELHVSFDYVAAFPISTLLSVADLPARALRPSRGAALRRAVRCSSGSPRPCSRTG